MKKMVATKSMVYRTRRLQAGDEFDASGRDARVLTAIGKAKISEPVKRRTARAGSAPRIETDPVSEPHPVVEQPADGEDLGLLTNAELRLIAEREFIDISACKVKADLVAAIEAARNGTAG